MLFEVHGHRKLYADIELVYGYAEISSWKTNYSALPIYVSVL